MELKELIVKIKNFQDIIIPESEYCWPLGDNYLFKETFYDLFTYSEKQDIAISTMRKQIDKELNIIDIELFELKITKPSEYSIICNELIPDLILILKSKYSENYHLCWKKIEKYSEQKIITINPDSEQNTQNENEIVKQKDKVALLKELGILDLLQERYPYLKKNGQRTTKLLMEFLDIPYTSLQPIINALFNETTSNKNYPKLTPKVQNVINKYTLEK
jgi:hypothetical protein